MLVWVHGGPEAQALPNWRPDLQAICALGIAVMVPNIRGSTGYGRAYTALDDRELRMDAVATSPPPMAGWRRRTNSTPSASR